MKEKILDCCKKKKRKLQHNWEAKMLVNNVTKTSSLILT